MEAAQAMTPQGSRPPDQKAKTASGSSLLTQTAQPLLSLILQILSTADLGDPVALRASVGTLFAQMERRSREAGVAAEDVLSARFALTAFIDEAVARSDWAGRGGWAQNPLSLEYFSTNNAGVEFFDKLEELRLRPAAHTDLLEVYHACLLLGFEGKYALTDPRQLRALIESIARDLERLRATPADLSPDGYLPDEVAARIRESIPLGVIAGIVVGVLFVLFLVLRFLGNGQAESVAAQLRALV